MSMMGVPSKASRLRTPSLHPSTAVTSTWCRPSGFGRCGERVLNTPRRACRRIAPRVHAEDVSTRSIEPGDDDDLITDPNAPQAFEQVLVEDEKRLRCTFVGLPWG